MKIKIQNFALSLFLLLFIASVLLWSVSLLFTIETLNVNSAKFYRDSWQLQLQQSQLMQRRWLQQRLTEVSDWMRQNPHAEQRLRFINDYYQRYAQIRLIQIHPVDSEPAMPQLSLGLCFDEHGHKASAELSTFDANVLGCMLNRQPVEVISARLEMPSGPQQLLIVIDYFAFLSDFEKLSGKHFYWDKKSAPLMRYIENGLSAEHSQARFEFRQGMLKAGSLSLALPVVNGFDVWLQQLFWVALSLLLVTLILYLLLFRYLISPLIKVTDRMKKELRTQRPGNDYESQNLAPGLMMLHRYYMHMTHIVRHDPLTGLNNKMIFEERLKHAILEGKRTGRRYALVLLDINNFYKVNKKLGHYIGDGLLKQLAKRLRSSLRETDNLARLEKDNFAFLLEFSDEEKVSSIIEKIYQSLSTDYRVYGRQVKVSISIGVAVYPDFALDREDLELKANEALIRAQQGNWPVVYAQPLAELMDHSGLSLIQSLHQALDNNEFMLVYQPVISLKTHTTRYFEALLRWKYPQQHSQSIEKTIQLAEKNQLIKPLSQWIVEAACEQLTMLNDGVVKIAVNLSMIDLHDEDLPDRVAETIGKYGVTADRLMIEITEGQIMQEPDQVIQTLTRLSEMGISLSIDDFGTGQASLTYLKRLPVEKLKIDQSFVKDMVNNEDDRSIVEATIKLAHTLGIEVVAEGVESGEIFELLLHMGCDFVQGYYISRPIKKEQIAEWLMAKVRQGD